MKNPIIRAVLGLASVFVLAVSAHANLLINASSEDPPFVGVEDLGAVSGWTSFGFTLRLQQAGPGPCGPISCVGARTGTVALKSIGEAGAFQDVSASAGQTFSASVWAINPANGDALVLGQVAALNIEWLDAGLATIGTVNGDTIDAFTPTDIWTLLTASGVAPAGTAYARVVLITGQFDPTGPGGGAPRWDDATLEVVSTVIDNANPPRLDIAFTVSGESGDYLYDFTITNESLEPIDVYAFIINEADLAIESSPAGWAQAFFAPVQWCTGGDCFDTTGGIAPGASLSGFTARGTSAEPLDQAFWTVGIVGPTVAEIGLPITSGDTAQYNGLGFAQGANGKYKIDIIAPDLNQPAQAFGINDTGMVVGGSADEVGAFAFVYDIEDRTYTNIGATFSALEINNAGIVVGSTSDLVDGDQCAIRDEFGSVTTFQTPTVSLFCQARGVNSNGKVSGFIVDEGSATRGFIYDTQTEIFEEFLPSPQTFAVGLNDSGELVGSIFLQAEEAFAGSVAGFYAFLRTPDGSVKYFSIAQSSPGQSRARGRSNSGLVSGWYRDAQSSELISYATTLSDDMAYEEITLTDQEIIYSKPCNLNLPAPPTPDYELFTDVTASQIRDDGVVVGSCSDTYFDELTGDGITYSSGFLATPVGAPGPDTDGDGVEDSADNCTLVANSDQRDTNGDGYGNICDPDFDNNGVVNFLDISSWVPFFNTACGDVDRDLNGDGVCNFGDYAIIPGFFQQPPGPSGIVP